MAAAAILKITLLARSRPLLYICERHFETEGENGVAEQDLSTKFSSVKIQDGSCRHFAISQTALTPPILNQI